MEARTDHCLVFDFVGSLRWAVDSPSTQVSGSGRRAAVEPASITLYGLRRPRDAGDFAETSGLRLRTVCDSANSESNAVHVEQPGDDD